MNKEKQTFMNKANQSRGGRWIMTFKEKLAFYGYVLFWLLIIMFMLFCMR